MNADDRAITDHTAVNWSGDPAALSQHDLLARMDALANYAAGKLRTGYPVDPANIREADRVLDMWEACRDALYQVMVGRRPNWCGHCQHDRGEHMSRDPYACNRMNLVTGQLCDCENYAPTQGC